MSKEQTKPSLVPPITTELLKKNAKRQKRWANLFVFKTQGVDEYSHRVISSNLEILQQLNKEIRRKGADVEKLRTRINILRDDTAIWLQSIGDFQKAAEIAFSREQRKLFKCYSEAVHRADDEWCEHPRWVTDANGNVSQNAYREFDFYSPKHGRKISMTCCHQCGFRNARDLDADLQKLSEHRTTARAAAEGLSKAEAEKMLSAEHLSTNLSKILR